MQLVAGAVLNHQVAVQYDQVADPAVHEVVGVVQQVSGFADLPQNAEVTVVAAQCDEDPAVDIYKADS